MSLMKIDNPEILTMREAMKKYADNYIGMRLTEKNLIQVEDSLGIVLYTVDTFEEQNLIPRKDENENYISVTAGDRIVDYPGGSFSKLKPKGGI